MILVICLGIRLTYMRRWKLKKKRGVSCIYGWCRNKMRENGTTGMTCKKWRSMREIRGNRGRECKELRVNKTKNYIQRDVNGLMMMQKRTLLTA